MTHSPSQEVRKVLDRNPERVGSALQRRLSMLALVLAGTVGASCAYAQGSAAPAPAARVGMHFIFDASASMCGYLLGRDERQTLLTLIRFASNLRDAEHNRRVLLLRQRGAHPAAADLAEPPAEFQALAATGVKPSACAPFDGVNSRPVQAFDKSPVAPLPRSFVLVSDMLLEEPALAEFMDRFRTWARAVEPGQVYSAGLLSLGVDFSGRYFPVTDKSVKRGGYLLPNHVRPLHVLWFTQGEADQRVLRDLLEELGVHGGRRPASWLYGVQVLPVVTTEPSQWLQGAQPPETAEQFFEVPRHKVVAADKQRSAQILQLCVQVALARDELQVKAPKSCKDGKPLFDMSVEHLVVGLPVRSGHGLKIDGATAREDVPPGMLVELTMKRETPATVDLAFGIKLRDSAFDVKALRGLSADTDTCGREQGAGKAASSSPSPTWVDACVKQLNGRTYRYEALVRQFAMRSEDVLRPRFESRKLNLRVRFEH